MTYDYKAPRRLNIVSLFLVLAGAAGIYLGVKFLPVWWQGRSVDEVLDTFAIQAVSFGRYPEEARGREGDKIVAKAVARLHELGVEDQADQPIEVWFTPDFTELHARYEVIVEHNFGTYLKPTVMHMHRVRRVPQ